MAAGDTRDRGTSLSRPPALVVPLSLVGLVWAVELLDRVLPGQWESHGVRPRSLDGLDGIAVAPLLHTDLAHLVANTVPLLVLGTVLAWSGLRTTLLVTSAVWIGSGLGTWLVGGAGTVHVGASGVVFGWIAYLVVRGLFSRRPGQIVVAVLVLAVYGTALLGVLPGTPGISWQGHLFGALSGMVAAWLLHARVEESHDQ